MSHLNHGAAFSIGATMLLSSIGFAIKLSRRTFLVIDLVGLHASFRGAEVAWTRQFGWVRG